MNNDESAKFRRNVLDTWSSLRSLGLTQALDLPQIAVIGSQSAGKSSVIESLCQIKLPRSIGTCTRCPIECRASYADRPWSARVYLMKAEQDDNNRSRWREEVPFGDVLDNPDKLEERIQLAQLAVLHPRIDPSTFLQGKHDPKQQGLTFTKNRVIVKVSGNQLSDLSIVDLPGIIANTSEQNVGDIELVQKLISSYMRKKNTINLIVITCESDFETQVGGRLAKIYDPNGERTIGVLTKVDRIEHQQERQWIPLIEGEIHPLVNGWFAVKQPTTNDRENGCTWDDARTQERKYFETAPGWSAIPPRHRQNLGTKHLALKVGEVLSTEMQKSLPGIRQEVDRLIKVNNEELAKLPEQHPQGPRDLIQLHVTRYVKDVEKHLIKGEPKAGSAGVVQKIRVRLNVMREEIQQAAPVFLPQASDSAESELSRPDFLPEDEVWLTRSTCGNGYTTEKVAGDAEWARTREWPGHYPFQVMLDYTERFVEQWNGPVRACFDEITSHFEEKLIELTVKHFGAYEYGGLHEKAKWIALELADRCKANTTLALTNDLDQEAHPESTHEDLYLKYESQFADYYRRFFDSTKGLNQLAKVLEAGADAALLQAISTLEQHGLPTMSPSNWRSMHPLDKSERSTLRIMSSVRAHYQVAFKRFSDKVKDTVNQSYVYAFGEEIENALRRGLQLNSVDTPEEYFTQLTNESEEVETIRSILKDKATKLHAARMKLS